jgi:uncharacterized protein YndB with AHSA1/START domain
MELHTEGKTTGDRIEMATQLKASRARVWRAISDPQELGAWFGLRADGPFTPGATVTATIAPTTVDAEVAKEQRPFEGMKFEMIIERVEPERLFSFRWHPFAVDRGVDYEKEPTTLVALALDDTRDGVTLTVTESGFERLPANRRAAAFAANQQGWAKQLELIQRYLARS